ncbi:MAG: hypothetical protein II951_13500 [Bacteroidales bacterium]|nr:hypothetical protein [Bacteroidales bacterium]
MKFHHLPLFVALALVGCSQSLTPDDITVESKQLLNADGEVDRLLVNFLHKGSVLQSDTVTIDIPEVPTEYIGKVYRETDINFDGVNDVLIYLGTLGTPRGLSFQAAYVWNPSGDNNHKFLLVPEYAELPDAQIDAEKKRVYSVYHEYTEVTTSFYAWDGNHLKEMPDEAESFSLEDEEGEGEGEGEGEYDDWVDPNVLFRDIPVAVFYDDYDNKDNVVLPFFRGITDETINTECGLASYHWQRHLLQDNVADSYTNMFIDGTHSVRIKHDGMRTQVPWGEEYGTIKEDNWWMNIPPIDAASTTAGIVYKVDDKRKGNLRQSFKGTWAPIYEGSVVDWGDPESYGNQGLRVAVSDEYLKNHKPVEITWPREETPFSADEIARLEEDGRFKITSSRVSAMTADKKYGIICTKGADGCAEEYGQRVYLAVTDRDNPGASSFELIHCFEDGWDAPQMTVLARFDETDCGYCGYKDVCFAFYQFAGDGNHWHYAVLAECDEQVRIVNYQVYYVSHLLPDVEEEEEGAGDE